MKRKFDEVNNINIIENNLNNLNKKSNIDIKIELLINEYKNNYGETNYLSYIISIYLEPAIFIKYDSNNKVIDIQPLLNYSFLDFYYLDRSYENELYNYIKEIEDQYNYIFTINPYFIKYEQNNILNNKLYKKIIELFNEKNNIKETNLFFGGSNNHFNEKKMITYENDNFASYFQTDFNHDFIHSSRSFLSLQTKKLLKNNFSMSETNYFKNIFKKYIEEENNKNNKKIKTPKINIYRNEYKKLNSLDELKVTINKMLKELNQVNSYIINEGGGLGHFFKNNEDYIKLKSMIENKFVFTFGMYLDSFNNNIKASHKKIYRHNSYQSILQYTISLPYKKEIYHKLYGLIEIMPREEVYDSGIYKYYVQIIQKDIIKLDKRANNVFNLSIFYEYILSKDNIKNIIKNHLYESSINEEYKRMVSRDILIIQKYSEPSQSKKIKKHLLKLKKESITKVNLYIEKIEKEYMELFFNNYLQIFINLFMYLIYNHYKEKFGYIFTKYNIKNEYDDYPYDNQEFINELRTLFRRNIKDENIYHILYIFGRIKLMGDFVQMLEVDSDFISYREAEFRNKKGFLITQDRILGSYCATIQNINYLSKARIDGTIYYFYRNIYK